MVNYWLIPGLDRQAYLKNAMNLDVQRFMDAFFLATNTNEYTLFGKSRKAEYVRPRQMLHYLMWVNFRKNLSFQTIGLLTGGKNHATVMHSKRAVLNDMETNPVYQEELIRVVTEMRKNFNVFPIKIVAL